MLEPQLFVGRRAWWTLVTAAAAAILGPAVAVQERAVGLEDPRGHVAAPRFAAARAVHLVLPHERLEIVYVDEQSSKKGVMKFSGKGLSFELRWQPGYYATLVRDRRGGSDQESKAAVLGTSAHVFRYAGPASRGGVRRFAALWKLGATTMELDGYATSSKAFASVLRGLRRVNAETWLAALPASSIKPVDRPRVVDEMIADITVPPEVDIAAIKRERLVKDRYQLGARVTAAVACSLLTDWLDATARGDNEALAMTNQALADTHNWAILKEMQTRGGWPEILWTYADVARGAATAPAGLSAAEYLRGTKARLGPCAQP